LNVSGLLENKHWEITDERNRSIGEYIESFESFKWTDRQILPKRTVNKISDL